MKRSLMCLWFVAFSASTAVAGAAETRGWLVTAGPTLGKTVGTAGLEAGGEVAAWRPLTKEPYRLGGVDLGLSTRAFHVEGQLAAVVARRVLLGLSAGAARRHVDGAVGPQATLWALLEVGEGHASLPIPFVPYLRFCGPVSSVPYVQAGLMLKLPVGKL